MLGRSTWLITGSPIKGTAPFWDWELAHCKKSCREIPSSRPDVAGPNYVYDGKAFRQGWWWNTWSISKSSDIIGKFLLFPTVNSSAVVTNFRQYRDFPTILRRITITNIGTFRQYRKVSTIFRRITFPNIGNFRRCRKVPTIFRRITVTYIGDSRQCRKLSTIFQRIHLHRYRKISTLWKTSHDFPMDPHYWYRKVSKISEIFFLLEICIKKGYKLLAYQSIQ